MSDLEQTEPFQHVLRVADLPARKATRFDITPDTAALGPIAAMLGLSELRKLRFHGQIAPLGKHDWHLTGQIGATVVQPCVISLAPVTTRVDDPVERNFIAGLTFKTDADDDDEIEMTGDDSSEPLGATIDLGAVMLEALALALPQYPKAEGVTLGEAVFSAPDTAPMKDEDARPFAGLAALRDKLSKDD